MKRVLKVYIIPFVEFILKVPIYISFLIPTILIIVFTIVTTILAIPISRWVYDDPITLKDRLEALTIVIVRLYESIQ